MSRFHFALDPVLRMRERTERERLAEVARLEAERSRLEAAIRREQATITQGQAGQRQQLEGRVDMTGLRSNAASSLGAMRRAGRLAVELAGAYHRIEEARVRLMLAARDRRAVERLREQRELAWRRDQDRREAGRLDDVAAEAWRRGPLGPARHTTVHEDDA